MGCTASKRTSIETRRRTNYPSTKKIHTASTTKNDFYDEITIMHQKMEVHLRDKLRSRFGSDLFFELHKDEYDDILDKFINQTDGHKSCDKYGGRMLDFVEFIDDMCNFI